MCLLEFWLSQGICPGVRLLYHMVDLFLVFKEISILLPINVISVLVQFSQFSRSVVSDCLRPHESQHARPPCPSPTPWVHSDSCPSHQWCHPAISSSVVPFSSCPQSLPASGSFPIVNSSHDVAKVLEFQSWVSATVLSMNTQDWSPLEWTGWISLQSKGLSGVFSNTTVQKHQFVGSQPSSQSNSHIHTWPQEKP